MLHWSGGGPSGEYDDLQPKSWPLRQLSALETSNSQMSAYTRLPAFDALIGPLVGRGYALAVTMLNDRSAAEDAVQEAAIKAWRKLPSLRDHSAAEPWFLPIVANQCRSVRRGSWWSVLKFPELRPPKRTTWLRAWS